MEKFLDDGTGFEFRQSFRGSASLANWDGTARDDGAVDRNVLGIVIPPLCQQEFFVGQSLELILDDLGTLVQEQFGRFNLRGTFSMLRVLALTPRVHGQAGSKREQGRENDLFRMR